MSRRILVVEDQEDNRRILRDLLTSAGYEIIQAENGEEALAAAARERPDLILMDIQLPVLDGYEATRRIKADPALRAIPVIVVTSYALSGDENKARAAGCDAYVTKPFSPRAKGFSHIRITPGCASLVLIAAQGIGRHNYDRNRAQCRIGLDAARCLIAVKHRQLDVHQDQVGPLSRRSS